MVPVHEIVENVAAVGEGVTSWAGGNCIGAGWHGGHDGVCGSCTKVWY